MAMMKTMATTTMAMIAPTDIEEVDVDDDDDYVGQTELVEIEEL